MTKHPLTSGLNGCIMRSEETEAAFSCPERWEYPVLLTLSVWVHWVGAKRKTLSPVR